MPFVFEHHLIDPDVPGRSWGQTAAADLDGCGRPEFVMGQRGGQLRVYKCHAPDRWTRHVVGDESPSDVGLAVLDVDGDGLPDLVTGGAWYRNSGDLDTPFERIVFDPDLARVHDIEIGDIDGDGRPEVVTLSDRSHTLFYRIPDDPRRPWTRHAIGTGVHAGLALGDLDGDGDLDVVRSTVWFENVAGDGSRWLERPIGPTSPPPDDFRPDFAFNASRVRVVDMTGNGKVNDLVFCDAEIPGGKVWWMENVLGDGQSWHRREIAGGETPRRGAYHGLFAGDLDGDGDIDLLSCEMEAVAGDEPPRWYVWENVDGRGNQWREHVILDANLGGHELQVADFDGDGRLDAVAKPWSPRPDNGVGGRMYVVYVRNVSG